MCHVFQIKAYLALSPFKCDTFSGSTSALKAVQDLYLPSLKMARLQLLVSAKTYQRILVLFLKHSYVKCILGLDNLGMAVSLH